MFNLTPTNTESLFHVDTAHHRSSSSSSATARNMTALQQLECDLFGHLLFEKIGDRDLEGVRLFLKDHPDADLANASDFRGHALHHAVSSTDEVLEVLALDPRTDGNSLNFGGASAFWCACLGGELRKAKILLALGKATPLEQKMGFTLHTSQEVAEKKGHAEIVRLLEDYSSNPERIKRQLDLDLGFAGKQTQTQTLVLSPAQSSYFPLL